ncbi:hypothetical protein [Crocosphaera sp.]|uniref:hypothetical protein n=1 Tax=Crocosphaera sp. TaxID=2729996 RepID=UPI00261FB25E|nr:hypothetical protein [Crocosphaera sp.]MDJ0579361.1 hypothetical protein [Crocosphaera sp.]
MADINGVWLGTYWQYDCPTRFEMTLVQGKNTLSGNILDDSSLGEANVTGNISGRTVTFRKCYLSGSRHCIDYVGTVSSDEKLIKGQWQEGVFNQGKWEAYRQDDNLTLNLEKVKSSPLLTVS